MATNLRAILGFGIALLLPAVGTADPAVPVTVREEVRWLQKLPEPSLKAMYLRCARVSSERMLSLDEASRCSAAADMLMRRSFGGDLDSLLAWWQQHREKP